MNTDLHFPTIDKKHTVYLYLPSTFVTSPSHSTLFYNAHSTTFWLIHGVQSTLEIFSVILHLFIFSIINIASPAVFSSFRLFFCASVTHFFWCLHLIKKIYRHAMSGVHLPLSSRSRSFMFIQYSSNFIFPVHLLENPTFSCLFFPPS